MDPSGGRDSRYNLNYSMGMMSDPSEIYGNPNVTLARPPSGGLGQVMNRGGGLMNSQNSQCGSGNNNLQSRGLKRTNSDCYDHERANNMNLSQNLSVLDNCGGSGVTDVNVDDNYTTLTQQNKKSPPSNGKKTKGRVKIKMEYIDNKLRRYTTFSKRKTGIMKKAYELSTLTGTQVMLLVASETGHVYTFATRKLQPMITSEAGKALIQTCLNSPDPPSGVNSGDQRMSATGFEETELSYNIADEDSKEDRSGSSSGDSDDSSGPDSPGPSLNLSSSLNNQPMEAHQSSHTSTSAVKNELKNSNLDKLVYSSAFANLPQDVILSLVQQAGGNLEVHEDGPNQFIQIPLSVMHGAIPSNRSNVKDTSNTNGRESPPNQDIIIKKECE